MQFHKRAIYLYIQRAIRAGGINLFCTNDLFMSQAIYRVHFVHVRLLFPDQIKMNGHYTH